MTNHAARKSLASQIDRLDSILDGLAEALNESVADAVRGVVGQAVREAVEATARELLASPALLSLALRAHRSEPEAPDPRPSLKDRLTSSLAQAGRLAAGAAQAARGAVAAALERLSGLARAGGLMLAGLWACRRAGALALGVGAAAGLASYLAGPALASAWCGVASGALALVGRLLTWPRLRPGG
jgi:hypothetical protein